MSDAIDLLPFPLRPRCGIEWCCNDAEGHYLHLSRKDGPQTLDEDGQPTAYAYVRAHRVDVTPVVEVGIWSRAKGNRDHLLSPDEARRLSDVLRLAAEMAEGDR